MTYYFCFFVTHDVEQRCWIARLRVRALNEKEEEQCQPNCVSHDAQDSSPKLSMATLFWRLTSLVFANLDRMHGANCEISISTYKLIPQWTLPFHPVQNWAAMKST